MTTSGSTKSTKSTTSTTSTLNIAGKLFRLSLELSDTPHGRRLASWNCPGSTTRYLNIELYVLIFCVLDGYVELT